MKMSETEEPREYRLGLEAENSCVISVSPDDYLAAAIQITEARIVASGVFGNDVNLLLCHANRKRVETALSGWTRIDG